MNGLNEFERSVKDALEPFEVPYNSADWAQLEQKLDQGKGEGRVSRSGLYALLLGGSLAAASSLVVLVRPTAMDQVTTASAVMMSGADVAELTQPPAQPLTNTPAEAPAEVATTPAVTTNVLAKGKLVNERTAGSKIASIPTRAPVLPAAKPEAGSAPEGPSVRSNVTEGCPGTLVEFAAENVSAGGIYLWNFGDGSFSNKPKPNHAFSKSGSFQVMLSHSSMDGGSIQNKPAMDRIVIHEAPEASFNTLKQEYENTVPSIHFENRSLGGKSYQWEFGDGATSVVAHPDHVFKKEGLYHVSLTVTNANGCVDRTERTVRITSDYDLLAPSAFSPNADATDDVFMPEALKTLGVKFHLSIFDEKSGAVVYETSDAQRPWNGKVSNRGETCAAGRYVWMVEMKDGEKLGGTYNGTVELGR